MPRVNHGQLGVADTRFMVLPETRLWRIGSSESSRLRAMVIGSDLELRPVSGHKNGCQSSPVART